MRRTRSLINGALTLSIFALAGTATLGLLKKSEEPVVSIPDTRNQEELNCEIARPKDVRSDYKCPTGEPAGQ